MSKNGKLLRKRKAYACAAWNVKGFFRRRMSASEGNESSFLVYSHHGKLRNNKLSLYFTDPSHPSMKTPPKTWVLTTVLCSRFQLALSGIALLFKDLLSNLWNFCCHFSLLLRLHCSILRKCTALPYFLSNDFKVISLLLTLHPLECWLFREAVLPPHLIRIQLRQFPLW